MKSIITVFGAFFFSIFVEGFIRVIIIFYHKGEFSLYGTSTLPGFFWAVVILISILIVSWLAGMLTVTITNFSPVKHLLSLALLFLLWRTLEIYQTFSSEPAWYLSGIILTSFSGLYMAYFTHKNTHAQVS